MFDRTFMPALTFTLLAAALGAFAADALNSRAPAQHVVVQLERVVVTAARELPPSPLALAEDPAPAVLAR